MKYLKDASKYNMNYYELPYEFRGATVVQHLHSEMSNLDDCFFGNIIDGKFKDIGIGFELQEVDLNNSFSSILKEIKILSTSELC